MKVKLKILGGSHDGKELKIEVPEFIIGRGDDAHLRPKSDLISRQHCAVVIGESGASVRDMGSRNGTFLNGERIEGEQQLKLGDHLRVGKLEFEVIIDHGLGGTKRPKVRDVKDAAARTAASTKDDEDITDWLDEGDEAQRAQRSSDPDTRQFKLDDTNRGTTQPSPKETVEVEAEAEAGEEATEEKTKKKKKEYGKLPPRAGLETTDSRQAAAETLKKFFGRR